MRYQTKVTPYQHQTEALARLRGRRAFALLMAMRTGKTKVLLDDFGFLELAGEVKDLLVIAPAGVYRTWVKAMEEHLSDDLRSRIKTFVWSSAKKNLIATKKEYNEFMAATGPRVLLMNVEALSSVKLARECCEKFLREPERAMIAVDESTIIKSPKTERTKYINRQLASRAAYRRILSGLPTPRSPLDLYCQFEFLNPRILNFNSYYAFQRRYAITQTMAIGGRRQEIVVGCHSWAAEELKRIIEPHSYRVEFRPKIPSTYTIREVSLSEEQRKAYNEMKQFATTELEGGAHVTATVVIAQILRLHRWCNWVQHAVWPISSTYEATFEVIGDAEQH